MKLAPMGCLSVPGGSRHIPQESLGWKELGEGGPIPAPKGVPSLAVRCWTSTKISLEEKVKDVPPTLHHTPGQRSPYK